MYSRRFAESATGWLNKYRFDPFFRTEVNVVGLQVAFSLVILGLVGTSLSLIYHDVSSAILQGLRAGTATGAPGSVGPAIVAQIGAIRTQNLLVIVSVITIVTVLFGYIVARVTLAPTRNALMSQKQFIGNIAHELRTPLAVIKTNTEVALMSGTIERDLKETLLSNVEELDRISEIINNLLSLSTLVRPERMEFSAVDLPALVSESVQKLSHLAKRSELLITVRKSPDCGVWGNSTALIQVVGNLLKNAIQYTPRGGEIVVTIQPSPQNQIELMVQDSGMGISQKDLFRIFEPFYRADPSRERRRGGSGLGLTIVSELVKLHQGKIAIRSAVGRGTSVSVLLPSAAGHGAVGQEVESKHRLNEIAVDFSSR